MIESEPNNSVTTANALALSIPVIGKITTSSDLDYYKVAITGAGMLSLTIDVPTNSTLDYYKLGLYSGIGSLLAAFTTGMDKTFQTPVAAAGDYYVSIGPGTYYGYSSVVAQSYSLTVGSTPGATSGYESESNNSVATADTLALSTPVIGQITTSSDLDYYKVSITGVGMLSLAIDVPTNSTLDHYKLGLYSGTGILLSVFTTGNNQTFQTPVWVAGDYYISVGPSTYYSYEDSAVNQYSLTVGNTLGTTSGYESESNNSVATADAIVLSTPVIGQITTSSDLDYYKVSIAGSGMLSLAIDVPTNSTLNQYKLGLYSGTGILLSVFTTGKDQTFQTPVSAAGDYYVSVGPGTYYSSDSSDVNQYSLTVGNTLGTTSGYESEPNNSVATADTLALSTPVIGQVLTSADQDYYKVSVNSAGIMSITFDAPTNDSINPLFLIKLYNSAGLLISAFSTGNDKAFQAQVGSAGDYYISIGADTSYAYADGVFNQYSLQVDNTAGSVNGYEHESNNSMATANALALSTPVIGQVLTSADQDYYKVSVSATGIMSITFDAPTDNPYYSFFTISIYDSGGKLLSSYSTGKDEEYRLPVGLTGDYYVCIGGGPYTPTTSGLTNQYSLSVGLAANNPVTGAVYINGTATQGQTLTAANTLADADGLGTISYQWQAAGVSIAGATASNYTLTQAEVGKAITVTASYTDGFGTAESKTSTATSAITNVNDLPTGSVTITGTSTQGQTLSAANTLADADGLGTINYQWKAAGVAITGATSSTLTLAEAQVGKTITVTASYIDGHGTNENLTSTPTALVVSAPPQIITGTSGNDSFTSSPGNDSIDGGVGIDTVTYSGTRTSHTVTQTSSGWTVSSGPDGTDTLTGIERLQFSNETLALDISGVAGQAYRVYQAAFNRTPDNAGLKFWIGVMDSGTSLQDVAAGFINSAEFQSIYGSNPTNEQFVTNLYAYVMHRPLDQAGYDFWVGDLNANRISRIDTLVQFSEAAENQANVIGVIQNGIDLFV